MTPAPIATARGAPRYWATNPACAIPSGPRLQVAPYSPITRPRMPSGTSSCSTLKPPTRYSEKLMPPTNRIAIETQYMDCQAVSANSSRHTP